MKVMNNLNLDTTRQHETVISRIPSPMTPQEQCLSPVPKDHRREKSDSLFRDGGRSDSEESSLLLDSPRIPVGEHSFDLKLQEQRNRSQSQIDTSLFLGNDLSFPATGNEDGILLDLDKPTEVLKWFTLQVMLYLGVSLVGGNFSFRPTPCEICPS